MFATYAKHASIISLISESVVGIRINIQLARGNLTTRHMHCLQDLTYDYHSLTPSRVEFAPLHS
jgi:hypothetical protein